MFGVREVIVTPPRRRPRMELVEEIVSDEDTQTFRLPRQIDYRNLRTSAEWVADESRRLGIQAAYKSRNVSGVNVLAVVPFLRLFFYGTNADAIIGMWKRYSGFVNPSEAKRIELVGADFTGASESARPGGGVHRFLAMFSLGAREVCFSSCIIDETWRRFFPSIERVDLINTKVIGGALQNLGNITCQIHRSSREPIEFEVVSDGAEEGSEGEHPLMFEYEGSSGDENYGGGGR